MIHVSQAFVKSRRTRHKAIVYEILAGLAHVVESYEFWTRKCAPQSAFWKEEV